MALFAGVAVILTLAAYMFARALPALLAIGAAGAILWMSGLPIWLYVLAFLTWCAYRAQTDSMQTRE